MCVNIMYIDDHMVCLSFTYPNRRIYCDAGCIYGRFLDMDSEEEEGQRGVLYRVAYSLCIVHSNVLKVGSNIS